jgi:iron complex transport system ATP-binding protein
LKGITVMHISHIIKKYDEKTVVNDVSFLLPKGKVTSLIGPNGAGKSTVIPFKLFY